MLLRAAARRAVAVPALARRDLTVAVTGASGYVGSYITEELLKRGHDVRALVRGCDTNAAKAAHLRALPGADARLTLIDGARVTSLRVIWHKMPPTCPSPPAHACGQRAPTYT